MRFSVEWVREFLDAITADRSGQPVPTPAPRETARRQRELARVDRELDAAGI